MAPESDDTATKPSPPYVQVKDCVEPGQEPQDEDQGETGPAQWVQDLIEAHGTANGPRELDDPERESGYIDGPVASPDDNEARWLALVTEVGISRYARELAEVEARELPDNPLFKAFRGTWSGRENDRDGAIIFGGEGTGKSVIAAWACRHTVRAGLPFDFLDAVEIAQVIGAGNWSRYGMMSETGLLVVDECGDVDDIRGTPFAYLKLAINRRYRADLPTILCSTALEEEFAIKWGSEILDRFPIRVGSGETSYRSRG